MIARCLDICVKGWQYSLEIITEPKSIWFLAWNASIRKAHLGEMLKLNKHKEWLKAANIKTIIDVGANTGQFSSAIYCFLPKAHIYAFEPLPDCYEILRRRLSRCKTFTAFCIAIGEKNGEVTFRRSSFSKASSVLPMAKLHKQAFPWSQGESELKVPQYRLDESLKDIHIKQNALLKIDVQGYELQVLKGAERILHQISLVLVETSFQPLYEGQCSFEQVYDFMKTHGFKYAGSYEQLLSPIDGTILQTDSLFIR